MKRSLFYLAALILILSTGGCLLPPKDTVPMGAVWKQKTPLQPAKQLIVFLPGRHDHPEDFIRNGILEELWASGIEADVVLADAHLGYYYRRTFSVRLRQDILEVAERKGYESIWVVGVSLGGFGAIMFEKDHPGAWDGVVLIAPFVGDQKNVLDQIHAAPDLQSVQFEAGAPGDNYTAGFWDWMKHYQENPRIPIFLGYGREDRMGTDQSLLADILPDDRVLIIPGQHKWEVWEELWQGLLPGLKAVMNASPKN